VTVAVTVAVTVSDRFQESGGRGPGSGIRGPAAWSRPSGFGHGHGLRLGLGHRSGIRGPAAWSRPSGFGHGHGLRL